MAHAEIFRALAECRDTGEFVAYHKWGDDPGIFLVGVVEALSSTQATFRGIDPHGLEEFERVTVALRLIHSLDRGMLYLRRLRLLHAMDPPPPIEERDVRKQAEIRALFEDAAREGQIVHVWTSAREAGDFLVLAVGEETVTLANVVDGGPADGRTLIHLRRIVRARLGWREIDDARVHRLGFANGFPPDR